MATQSNISFFKGETIQLNFTMAPVVNVTGWTITLTVKNSATDAVALLTVTPATIDSGPAGTFHLNLTKAQTLALGAGSFAYDVQRVDATFEAVLAIGRLFIIDNVFNG